jgi:V/A-type H+-transporting ATPase subunit E
MGYKELVEALKTEGEEKILTIRQQAETEVEAIKADAAKRIEEIQAEHERTLTIAIKEQADAIVSDAAAEVRVIRLRAEKELSDRLYRQALSSLYLLREKRHSEVFDALVKELPRYQWEVLKVNPADVTIAKTRFPDAEIIPDPMITGGLEAMDKEGRIRIINTFEKRIERAWPEILPALIEEIEPELQVSWNS